MRGDTLVNRSSNHYTALRQRSETSERKPSVNGAELLVKTAVKAGIDICFANAGTTEMPIVVALDSESRIKPVLCLFEGVCTGAADGYGRMLDKPAMTLLHLGPGFADGISNLHNARRAKTPVLNIVGEHATWHRASDPPLAMDIERLAGAVSGWHCVSGAQGIISHGTGASHHRLGESCRGTGRTGGFGEYR